LLPLKAARPVGLGMRAAHCALCGRWLVLTRSPKPPFWLLLRLEFRFSTRARVVAAVAGGPVGGSPEVVQDLGGPLPKACGNRSLGAVTKTLLFQKWSSSAVNGSIVGGDHVVPPT